MLEVCKCNYCKSIIEYDPNEDIYIGSDHIPTFILPYILCPECGNAIIIGHAKI